MDGKIEAVEMVRVLDGDGSGRFTSRRSRVLKALVSFKISCHESNV